MSAPPLLELRNASLGYGDRIVLAGVNLQVRSGEFLGILGSNGSGKSTLIRTMLGLIAPINGQFLVRGARDATPRFGYVPQKEKLDPIFPLTALEVAAMGTFRKVELFQRLRGRAHVDLVRQCLKDCGAIELAERRYSDLSGGQRQRVLIARALAAEPEVLVLDEPLAGIDVVTQKALIALFQEFKDRRLTVLMISHRVRAERKLFTHVAWAEDGRLETGTAETMLSKSRLAKMYEFD
jgi:ABC-type Mn2+/Zn2+ transport system ATPase subunit